MDSSSSSSPPALQHAKAIAFQLRKLANDSEGALFLAAEPACLAGLLALIARPSEDDVETLLMALQAISMLSLYPVSRSALLKYPSLMPRVADLINSESSAISAEAHNALNLLNQHSNSTPLVSTSEALSTTCETETETSTAMSRALHPDSVECSVAQSTLKSTAQEPLVASIRTNSSISNTSITTGSMIKRTSCLPTTKYLLSLVLQAQRVTTEERGSEGISITLTSNERSELENTLIIVPGIASVSVLDSGKINMHCKAGSNITEVANDCIRTVSMLPQLSIKLTHNKQSVNQIHASSSNKENQTTQMNWSSSKAIVPSSTVAGASLQSRFQLKTKRAVEMQQKKQKARGLLSAVSSFFW